jgi:hypothetical protein
MTTQVVIKALRNFTLRLGHTGGIHYPEGGGGTLDIDAAQLECLRAHVAAGDCQITNFPTPEVK